MHLDMRMYQRTSTSLQELQKLGADGEQTVKVHFCGVAEGGAQGFVSRLPRPLRAERRVLQKAIGDFSLSFVRTVEQ